MRVATLSLLLLPLSAIARFLPASGHSLDTRATPETAACKAKGRRHGGGGGRHKGNWGKKPSGEAAVADTVPQGADAREAVVTTVVTEAASKPTEEAKSPESAPSQAEPSAESQPEPDVPAARKSQAQTKAPEPAQTKAPAPSSKPAQPAPKPKQEAVVPPAPAPKAEPKKAAPQPASGGTGDSQADWIAAHTNARAKYGAGAVTWSAGAAAQAQANVDKHKNSCSLEHTTAGKFGENLTSGSGGSGKAIANDIVGGWMDESKDFNYDSPEGIVHGTKVVGHFTAVVWKSVTGVGCAVGKCGASGTYIACCYEGKGGPNLMGSFAAQVPRPL